jgi:hypothetical protein
MTYMIQTVAGLLSVMKQSSTTRQVVLFDLDGKPTLWLHDRPDRSQRMICRNPLLDIHVGKQCSRPLVRTTHSAAC